MNQPEENQRPKLRDYVAVLVRRRKAIRITAAACIVTTLALTFLLPAYYQSTGTILIQQQEVPQDLVRSTVTSYADERVQEISERVMTTQNLLDIIHRYDLYPAERKRKTREQLIERMRKDVDFKMISADVVDPRSGVPRQATIAFTVAYRSRSADQAVRVATELVNLYLNENLTERTRLAEDASGFLKDESGELSKHIAELEAQLAKFKSEHLNALPDTAQINLQFLDRAEQDLRDTETRRMSVDQQRVYLQGQLAQMKPNSMLTDDDGQRIMSPTDRLKLLKSQLASAEALYAPSHPDIARLKREIAGLEAQEGNLPATNDLLRDLEQARGELGQARQKYAENHPDVQRLQKRVAALEAAVAAQPSNGAQAATPGATQTAAAQASATAGLWGSSGRDKPDNPAYIELQAQLNGTTNDLHALDEQIAALRNKVEDYRHKVMVEPEVERQYRQLTRDYESAQVKYQEVRSKQMEAQFAQNLEADRKGERFELIEPPLPPEEPVSPNRPAILILGFILTLGLGAGVAAILESVDETVRGRLDVTQLLAASPLALVPRIVTQNDLRIERRRFRLALGATALAGIAAILAIHFLYMPLDVLWFTALRHFGM